MSREHWTLSLARGGDRVVAQLMAWAVRAYRLLLSPWLGGQCRFTPSCSSYALQALDSHGGLRGSLLIARRLIRCHPWCAGGLDPVPANQSASAAEVLVGHNPSSHTP